MILMLLAKAWKSMKHQFLPILLRSIKLIINLKHTPRTIQIWLFIAQKSG
ncbi:hypothetical protein HanRHA438_Chr13g0622981 [Helianthus annuus]|nr:hypothetical protein HanRHA438_Chr13g0622981 [Helianthus annuus]